MTWTILLIKKSNNGWFINYIENKLINQIIKNNLQEKISVLIFEPNIHFSSDFISVIDEEIDISDNFINNIYSTLNSCNCNCIGLKGVIKVNEESLIFNNNISKIKNEISLPLTKLNPIKIDLIFKKFTNIIYYINSQFLPNIAYAITHVSQPIVFLERITKKTPISIIISAYQTQDYIEECLDSIENQTYFINNDNFEVLVGVDGCKDTLNKLNQIKHKYRNLYIHMMTENKGTYITANTLIDLVKNEDVIRFDSDDVMTPNLVNEVIKDKNDSDIAILGSIDLQNGKIGNKFLLTEGVIYFKKSIMDNIAGGYMPWRCSADTELIKRLVNKVKIIQIKKTLFYRRIHSKSLTQRPDTGYYSDLRIEYKKQIKQFYNDNEIKIERIVNKILKTDLESIVENKEKYKLVYMISTYNRLNYLRKTIESWYNTCDKKYNWTLIIADDGSNDGTLEYLYNLNFNNIKIFIIENNRRGVHHQTNSMLKIASNLDFDYGFKSDDDLIFLQKNWDNLYINASLQSGYYHLIFYDKKWGNRRGELRKSIIKNNLLENNVLPQNIQGAFWTFNKEIINTVGFFDTDIYNLCGLGHVDYSLRCCRLGYNDINNPYDAMNSNSYISLIKEQYVSHNNFKLIWNTNDILIKKRKYLFEDRTYIKYNELNKNLLGDNIDYYDISFIIPLRGREEQIEGLEFNIKNIFNDYKYEIIYVNQEDNKLFKRGQLCNIGFKESKGHIIIFQDVDIRHLRKIDVKKLLNEYKKPFVAFDSITQLNENELGIYDIIETEKRPYGYGACAIFTREQFIISGGFSNLIFGWGVEDTIMNKRVGGYVRYNQNLGHVYHKPMRKDPKVFSSEWYKNNKMILNTHNQRAPQNDGYLQTDYDMNLIKYDNINKLNITNIKVKNFQYTELYNQCLKNDTN